MNTSQLRLAVVGIAFIALLAITAQQADAAARSTSAVEGAARSFGRLRKLLAGATPDRGQYRVAQDMAAMQGGGRAGGAGGPGAEDLGHTSNDMVAALRELCRSTGGNGVAIPACLGHR